MAAYHSQDDLINQGNRLRFTLSYPLSIRSKNNGGGIGNAIRSFAKVEIGQGDFEGERSRPRGSREKESSGGTRSDEITAEAGRQRARGHN